MPETEEFTWRFEIGQIVRTKLQVPKLYDLWLFVIIAREVYQYPGGQAEHYYVRQYDPSGQPSNDVIRFHGVELEDDGGIEIAADEKSIQQVLAASEELSRPESDGSAGSEEAAADELVGCEQAEGTDC